MVQGRARALRARPSAFLRDYSAWLARRGEARTIQEEQLAFLEGSYAAAGLTSLLPALLDLVRLHGAWGRALAEGETSLLALTYDPDDLLGSGPSGLSAFAKSVAPRRASWHVIPDESEGARIEKA